MKHEIPWAALLAAALVAGCGSDEEGATPPPTPATEAAVTLSGVVAKGALRHASVKVHAVAADGRVDTATALADTLSDADGRYTLGFTGTAHQPYVLRVTPRPAGQTPATTQLDEIAGPAPVADGFAIRALFVPAAAGRIDASVHVTPFSEIAVAAAEKGSGAINAANAAQAMANAAALLGFDPAAVTPTTIAGAAAGNVQQLALATALTAVSKLANDGALGCAQPVLAERTACVTGALAASATLASTKPGRVGGTDVAAALADAVLAVVAANDLPATTAAVVVANLQGAGTPPPGSVPGDVQSGIPARKAVFDNLRSDWQALFGGGAGSTAATEARKFADALHAVQVPVDMVLKDAGALLMGIDLYRDYMAGRTTVNNRGRAATAEFVSGGDVDGAGTGRTAVGCSLYTDTTNTVLARNPAQVQSIGCQAVYRIVRQGIAGGSQYTLWRHGFTLTPGAAADSYTYTTRARRSVEACTPGCVRTVNDALQTSAYAGTVTVTPDAAQHVVGFSIQGELPGAFEPDGTALVNERHAWTLAGTRAFDTASGESLATTVTGSIAAYAAGSANAAGTLKFTNAKLGEVLVSRTAGGAIVRRGHPSAVSGAGSEIATADLPLEWTTPAAAFAGRLELADSVWDASGTAHLPTRVVLTGQFRNVDAAGAVTEFLSGTVAATVGSYAQFDASRGEAAGNRYTVGLQFNGSITAAGRPTLALTLATGGAPGQEPTAMTAQLRTLVGGSATQTVNLAIDRPAGGSASLTFGEAASGLTLQYVQDAATATLRRGSAGNGVELGTLTLRSRLMTFVDGSTMSLDFGL